jgi:hypothetical protein
MGNVRNSYKLLLSHPIDCGITVENRGKSNCAISRIPGGAIMHVPVLKAPVTSSCMAVRDGEPIVTVAGQDPAGNTGRSLSIPCFETRVGYPRSKVPFFFPTFGGPGAIAKTLPAGQDLRGKALKKIVTGGDNSTGNTGSGLNARPRAESAHRPIAPVRRLERRRLT